MNHLIHELPSVGSVVKRMLALNPNLSAAQIVDFIKQSTYTQGGGEPTKAEVIDQERALELVRSSRPSGQAGVSQG
jgi:hypothetical protein